LAQPHIGGEALDVPNTLRSALADRYAIERELGQGGMATVYLAVDLKHHRKVALKVLRPEIAVTVGADRFSREIEVAARLQHPNILPLLDSGEATGFFFYVMPYVEGESLRDRLARGGELPIPDVVRILMEVADALSHAHAHGVVHRDIKPDNVLLSGRHALVADFGVAKAVTEATGRQVLTSAGVALGTPTYMAPEQATADPHQDHRVDIYALGVLGYELLTGRAPFSATTAQEMLAAHVTAVPEPVERYRPTVSPALAQIIMKCLAKKPADRWQTAEEVLQHLEPLATPSGGTTPTQTQPTTAIARLPRWAKWAAGVAAVAVVALVATQVFKSKPLTIAVSGLTQVTNDRGVEFEPAISPDGNEVVYAGGSIEAPHLLLRSATNVAGRTAVRLGDSTFLGAFFPSWTPDGQSVRFGGCTSAGQPFGGCSWMETGKLGGAVQAVALPTYAGQRVWRGWSVGWSPDGRQVAIDRGDTIFVASVADTVWRRVAVQPQYVPFLHSFAWSPDAQWLAYVNGNASWRFSGNLGQANVWIVRVAGGMPQPVTTGDHLNVSPVWLDASHLLYVSDQDGQRAVYVVEVGPRGVRGEARIVPGVADPHSISYSQAARMLAYAKFTMRQNIWAYPLARPAPISISDGQPVTTGTQVLETEDVSPDGRWIAYSGYLRNQVNLYKLALGGAQAVPLTSGVYEDWPRWSPDGREIAYMSNVGNGTQIFVMSAQGGAPVAVSSSVGRPFYPSWSPNGLQIAFQWAPSKRWGIWLASRDSVGGAWHEATPLGDLRCVEPTWAPDGRALACWGGAANGDLLVASPQSGQVLRRGLFAANRLSSLEQGFFRYSPDGRSIYAAAANRDGRRGIWAIPVAGGPARLVITFDHPALAVSGMPGFFSVGPDRLYLTVSEYESDIWVAKLRY
jgi:serine/threonine-protein kinase